MTTEEELIKSIQGKSLQESNKLVENYIKERDKKEQQKLGVVYTPLEVVEFINNSVCEILKKEFNIDINDDNVNIIDPFTGTGTFMVDMLDRKLEPEAIERKNNNNELHTIELMPLSHKIAQQNLDNVIKKKTNKDIKFKNNINTDTFELYEKEHN